jgi:hypothetical protein
MPALSEKAHHRQGQVIASDTSIKREKQKLRVVYLEIPQNDKGIDGQSEFRL